ncbi:MAG: hypothetical protein J0I06_22445 [Planctomycetes bacterium]|jgi:predicted membrane protein (TIGR00267 family)|nr:hypothetical protein [Planctomycetota bacterium]
MSRILSYVVRRENVRSLIAGVCDGILTALTLTAARLLDPASPVGYGLAVRVAAAAFLSGAFVFFVAHYAELRVQLVRAERELNLTSHGRLATTRLGRAVAAEAATAALVASLACFAGALIPLLVAAAIPRPTWLGIGVAIAALGVLGGILGWAVYGRPLRWAVLLTAGGGVLTAIGAQLHVV